MLSDEMVVQSLVFEYMGRVAGALHSCATNHTVWHEPNNGIEVYVYCCSQSCVAGQCCPNSTHRSQSAWQ